MSDIEFFAKLRDAACMIKDAAEEYLEKRTPKEGPHATSAWDPVKIKWVPIEGTNGPYEKSEDVNNPDFKAMLKDLADHQGKLSRDGLFYWKFDGKDVVGRKKRK